MGTNEQLQKNYDKEHEYNFILRSRISDMNILHNDQIKLLKTDLKENKSINSTLRYVLLLTLILFISSIYFNTQQRALNRVLRTSADKVIMQGYKLLENNKNQIALEKYHNLTVKQQNVENKRLKTKRLKK